MPTVLPEILSLNISRKKGTRKDPVEAVELIADYGISGDAHAGDWHRQVSFLASEAIETARAAGLDVSHGDFAENITTRGIDWCRLPIGTRFHLGGATLLEITQIGKTCHKPCAIYYKMGDCIMPKQGVFAKVITGGTIRVGDTIQLL